MTTAFGKRICSYLDAQDVWLCYWRARFFVLHTMSVPLRSALKTPVSRPDSPSLTSTESTTFRIPSPPIGTPSKFNEFSPVSVLPESHSISSLLPSTSHASSSNVIANNLSQPRHQPISSPTPTYTPKVSFDTFENPVASMFSFTLQVKSEGYKRTRNTRVFLCASSPDESGREALEWSLESLVQEGDELIVFRGVDEDVLGDVFLFLLSFYFGNTHLCPFLDLEKDHDIVREEARELMKTIQEKSFESDPDRKVCFPFINHTPEVLF